MWYAYAQERVLECLPGPLWQVWKAVVAAGQADEEKPRGGVKCGDRDSQGSSTFTWRKAGGSRAPPRKVRAGKSTRVAVQQRTALG
jgi:hypothetical protein